MNMIGEGDENFIDNQELQHQSGQPSSCEEHSVDSLGEEKDITIREIRGLKELLQRPPKMLYKVVHHCH